MFSLADAHPVVVAALGTAVKSKQLADAKTAIKEGANERVHILAEITGQLTKEHHTPGNSGTKPASIDLANAEVLLAVLAMRGVTARMLKATINKMIEEVESLDDLTEVLQHHGRQELRDVIDSASAEIAERLPDQPFNTPARAGAVRFKPQHISIIESQPPCNQPAQAAA